jgi:hypothetical protein
MLHNPVLKSDITSDPPWLPMPTQARLTLSPGATDAVLIISPSLFLISGFANKTCAGTIVIAPNVVAVRCINFLLEVIDFKIDRDGMT